MLMTDWPTYSASGRIPGKFFGTPEQDAALLGCYDLPIGARELDVLVTVCCDVKKTWHTKQRGTPAQMIGAI